MIRSQAACAMLRTTAMLTPIAKPASKPGFHARVLALMATPSAPKLDVMVALQEGRK